MEYCREGVRYDARRAVLPREMRMNLKSAARLLGVHYQTAYRYVRAGELVAVRVGAGYEISEAAVEMLKARLAAKGEVTTFGDAGRPHDARTSVGDELIALVQSCTLSAHPVFELVTRWLGTSFGDMSALHLLSEDGVWLQPICSYDPDPTRRAVIEAFNSSTMVKMSDAFGSTSILEGHTVVVHHLSVDDAIRFLPRRFKEYADRLTVQSFVSAPVKTAHGRVRGVLSVSRFVGGRPYTADEVSTIERMAGAVAAAVERVERFSAAWVARDSLFDSLERLFALDPGLQVEQVSDVVLDLLDDELAEAVFDPGRRMVAANEQFMSRLGLPTTPAPLHVGDGSVIACSSCDVEVLWARLLSGASDFITTDVAACPDWPGGLRIHWAVVRRPDASPAAVVAACEAGSGAAADTPAAAEALPPCWGLCSAATRHADRAP